MQPSKEQIAAAARLVPGEFEWYCRGANNPNGEPNVPCIDGTEWQPWADTKAGRSDALVLLAAVLKWFSAMDSVDYMKWPKAAFDVELLLQEMGNKENLFEVQAATFAAAAAIGAHIKGRKGNE